MSSRWARTAGTSPFLAWNFYSSTEGWTPGHTTSSQVADGIWTIIPEDDPYLTGPGISISAREFKYVQVRMKSQCSGPASIYFKTAANDSWAEARRVNFNPAAALLGFAELSVPVSNHPEWASDATITAIRLDPCDFNPAHGTGLVQVDYIRLSPTP